MVTQVVPLSKHPVILYFPVVSLMPCNDHRLMGLWFPRSSLETFYLAPCSILQAPRNFLACGAQLITPSLTTLIITSLFHLHFLLELLPKYNLLWTWTVAFFFSVCPISCPAATSDRYSGKSPRKDLAWESFQFLPQWMSTQMVKSSNNGHSFSALLCPNHH